MGKMELGGYNTTENQLKANEARNEEEHKAKKRLYALEHKENLSKIQGKGELTQEEQSEMEELQKFVKAADSRNVDDTSYLDKDK